MAKRVDAFMDEQLLLLFDDERKDAEFVVAIVSHGLLLAHFWRRLLLRLPRKSLSISPEVTAARGNVIMEYLGGWSNTGYMGLSVRKDEEKESSSSSKPDCESYCICFTGA